MSERLPERVVATLADAKILGIRVGTKPHRVIGIWVVVVEGRVFVRSWSLSPGGWYRTLREEPVAVIAVAGRELPVRAVFSRSERIRDLVSHAYLEKYRTPGSVRYARDLGRKRSRDTTTELVPRPPRRRAAAASRGAVGAAGARKARAGHARGD